MWTSELYLRWMTLLLLLCTEFVLRANETAASSYGHHHHHPVQYYAPTEQSADGIFCKERLQGQSYCQDVPNYEEQAQLHKISPEQLAKFGHYFKEDLIQPESISIRMNSPTERNFCESRMTLLNPKGAETKDAKWMLILQDQNHKQGIYVELCENEGSECKIPGNLELGYHTKCKQYHVFRTMVVVKDGELKEESVKLPNCCKCVYWQS